MDWTKAKSIIIAALLVTNLFLIVTYRIIQVEDVPTEEMLQSETIALLEAKNIYVEGPLPTKHPKMPVLSVEYDRLDSSYFQELIWQQTPLDDSHRSRESILQMTEDFLRKCGIWGANVELDRIEQKGQTSIVSYRNVYQGMKVEDSYIICTVQGGQVTEIDRYWLNPVELGKTKKATMSASAALISFMSEKHKAGSILVEKIEMVYWLDSTEYDGETTISDTAFPSWKITYNGGQVKHIRAYTE
jgi:hypothetical protein